MERRADPQQLAVPGAPRTGDLDRSLDRRAGAAHHRLSGSIIVGRDTNALGTGLCSDLDRDLQIDPEQGRHRALTDRHRPLHGQSAPFQEPCGIG